MNINHTECIHFLCFDFEATFIFQASTCPILLNFALFLSLKILSPIFRIIDAKQLILSNETRFSGLQYVKPKLPGKINGHQSFLLELHYFINVMLHEKSPFHIRGNTSLSLSNAWWNLSGLLLKASLTMNTSEHVIRQSIPLLICYIFLIFRLLILLSSPQPWY